MTEKAALIGSTIGSLVFLAAVAGWLLGVINAATAMTILVAWMALMLFFVVLIGAVGAGSALMRGR